MSDEHVCSAGDAEPAYPLERPAASFPRREPVVASAIGAGIALGAGVARSTARRQPEEALLFAGALGLLAMAAWAARGAVTPVALPRRDADSPLIDAPPELLGPPAEEPASEEAVE